MANEVNNPNEIAHGQIGLSVSGEDQVKKSIQSVIDKLAELHKMGGSFGIGGGGPGGSSAGGADGAGSEAETPLDKKFKEAEKALDDLEKQVEKLNGSGNESAGAAKDTGIIGMVSGLGKALRLFGALAAVHTFKRMAEDINNATIALEKMRHSTQAIGDSIGMNQSAADLNVSSMSKLTGIDPILLTARSQGPAQRAARAQASAGIDAATANAIEIERQQRTWSGMTAGLSEAFPQFFTTSSDVKLAQSRISVELANQNKLMEAARRSDQVDQIIAIRKMSSSQKR